MTITNEEEYKKIDARIEELFVKGSALGDVELLTDDEKVELKVLSEAAYDWECEQDPHPWRVNHH